MVNPRVLIVEDVDSMAELVKQLLEGIEGLTVSAPARNTAEARLEWTRRRPDLVLLDEILPGESSYDLLQELVKDGIPVILISGVHDPAHELPAGAFSRLAKPTWKTLDADRKRYAAEIQRALLGSHSS